MNSRTKLIILSIVNVPLLIMVYLNGPISQDLGYHHFADHGPFIGIANGWNVLSNIPFLIIGLIGMIGLSRLADSICEAEVMNIARVFFVGLIFTAFGSAYYHLNPNNATLLWDRIPMTISFMAFFSFILATHINKQLGARSLWPLLMLGLVSVLYWAYTEKIGDGDLRLYIVVQFFPMIVIPLIMLMFPTKEYRSFYIWLVIILYAISKVLELYDYEIYNLISIGGHALKHVVASLSGLAFLKAVASIRRDRWERNTPRYD